MQTYHCTSNGWLEDQEQQCFGEIQDKVHISCRTLRWKVTKYDVVEVKVVYSC